MIFLDTGFLFALFVEGDVDCLSFVVMEKLGIHEALAVDSDFSHRFIARPGPLWGGFLVREPSGASARLPQKHQSEQAEQGAGPSEDVEPARRCRDAREAIAVAERLPERSNEGRFAVGLALRVEDDGVAFA